ncbi:MAG: response regulator [Nitrospiraceae bacterium]|nr:response regulator [Nitrospiraceae bacterium]
MYNILIVDDDEQMRVALCASIKYLGFNATSAKDAKVALKYLKSQDFDVIISDLKMPKIDGIEFLKKVKKSKDIPFIMITAVGSVESAVESMKLGAFDFILKPFSNDTLKKVIDLAISHRDTLAKNSKNVSQTSSFVVESQKMKEILQVVDKVAKTDATILLIGESGTGKEVVARYIHNNSSRSHKPFIGLNCAAIPDNLLENELFGHEKGSFSGATCQHKGKFEQACGGSLLLDEISEMPLALQAKLLRVLQEKVVDRIGSKQSIPIDARIICTTNKSMENEVKDGRFREDLYYRINVFPKCIPYKNTTAAR